MVVRKEEMQMERVALFELGTSNLRLSLYKVKEGEHFIQYKQISERINITEHIEEDRLIKPSKIKECVAIIQMLKRICESEGVSRYIAEATNSLNIATNYQSFVNELGLSIGVDFRVLSAGEEIASVYTAVTNTVDAAKGVIINISSQVTRIIHYNRRIILDSATLPYGTSSIGAPKCENHDMKQGCSLFKKVLEDANLAFLSNLEPETVLVGVGDVFSGYARMAKRLTSYPLESDHIYVSDKKTFDKVFEFISTLAPEKKQRLKGISETSVSNVQSGMCIISAIIEHTKLDNIVVTNAFRNVGVMFKYTIPYTTERPITDMLGYSLDMITYHYHLPAKRCEKLYDLALMLFKQFKVLHRLPRNYAKVLRIAAYMSMSGGHSEFHQVLNLPVLGVTHKEIVLAAFVVSCRRWEDFSLAEWVKYKSILQESDLEAARKLANILSIAEAMNIRNQDIIKDINCDILGESVILKLVTETDPKSTRVDPNAAQVEIYFAKKCAPEFNRSFKKSLEIL